MSWEIFKQNINRLASNPNAIPDIDTVAEAYAKEYDAAIRRGGDTIHKIPIKRGNVELMKQLFKAAFLKGQNSKQPYDLVGEMGKGVLAYWSGAIMENIPVPIIPAPGTILNYSVVSNQVTNPGTWVGAASSNAQKLQETEEEQTTPTEEEPAGPKEIEPMQDGEIISASEIDSTINSAEESDYVDPDVEDDVQVYKENIQKRSLTKSNERGASFDTPVDISNIDTNANWVDVSSKYIASKEGFLQCAANDEGTLRLGYGTDKILQSNGTIRKVRAGDCTTKEAALKVLKYEVSKSYLARLVGVGERKISQTTFDSLSSAQKAACMSMVYNCGSLTKSVATAIRSGNQSLAIQAFKNGPVKGAQSGKVYPGLVQRRNEEAKLFSISV